MSPGIIQKANAAIDKPLEPAVLGSLAANPRYMVSLGRERFDVFSDVIHKCECSQHLTKKAREETEKRCAVRLS